MASDRIAYWRARFCRVGDLVGFRRNQQRAGQCRVVLSDLRLDGIEQAAQAVFEPVPMSGACGNARQMHERNIRSTQGRTTSEPCLQRVDGGRCKLFGFGQLPELNVGARQKDGIDNRAAPVRLTELFPYSQLFTEQSRRFGKCAGFLVRPPELPHSPRCLRMLAPKAFATECQTTVAVPRRVVQSACALATVELCQMFEHGGQGLRVFVRSLLGNLQCFQQISFGLVPVVEFRVTTTDTY